MTEFLTDIAALRRVRITDPGRVARLWSTRARRPLFAADSRMMIVACDHPARGALGVGGDALAMADREDLLGRLLVALDRSGVDGVLGTADILDDLLLLGALEDKLVFTSLNRGGLQGAAFELDDRMTAYDVDQTVEMGADGAKLLARIDLSDPATASTLEACARAISQCNRASLPVMVEPFLSRRVGGKVTNDLSPDAVIRSIAIAQGLGSPSAYTWMKLPVVDEMERVMAATTMPTLLLGGEVQADPDSTYARWSKAVALPSVVGLIVGRSMLFPADGDVAGAVDTAVGMIR